MQRAHWRALKSRLLGALLLPLCGCAALQGEPKVSRAPAAAASAASAGQAAATPATAPAGPETTAAPASAAPAASAAASPNAADAASTSAAPARTGPPSSPEVSPDIAPEMPAEQAAPLPGVAFQEGLVSFYGQAFAGRKTASGERFDPQAMTMAHKTLPFGTRVRVTVLRSGLSVVVRVNDRGPWTPGRVADVSAAAARELGLVQAGVLRARLDILIGR